VQVRAKRGNAQREQSMFALAHKTDMGSEHLVKSAKRQKQVTLRELVTSAFNSKADIMRPPKSPGRVSVLSNQVSAQQKLDIEKLRPET
jgi:hypothetical protein